MWPMYIMALWHLPYSFLTVITCINQNQLFYDKTQKIQPGCQYNKLLVFGSHSTRPYVLDLS